MRKTRRGRREGGGEKGEEEERGGKEVEIEERRNETGRQNIEIEN